MLSDILIKPIYKSLTDNVNTSFYLPCLSEANKYMRVSAYFDSKALAFYSKGLAELNRKNGKYYLIMSNTISEEDYLLIKSGYEIKDTINMDIFKLDETFLDDKDKMRLSNLSYLIAIGLVEIKMAFVKEGIFHDKFGLIFDECNNSVYFRGSNNETGAAISKNYESFETTLSWSCSPTERDKINEAIITFNRLWDNHENGVITIDMPEIIEKELLKFNKGKIIMDESIEFYDYILVDFRDDHIICKNYVKEFKFNADDFYFKRLLLAWTLSVKENQVDFKSGFNYGELKKLIKRIEDFGNHHNIAIQLSQLLEKYISERDLKIDKRYKLGIDIKGKENSVEFEFEKFCEQVNNEMYRKLRIPQLWGAFHFVSMRKAANFSVPGTGKTSIVYGAFSYLSSKDVNKIDKIVVVGPLNSFLAWKEEFNANFNYLKKLSCYDTQRDSKSLFDKKYNLKFESAKYNLILVNYESLPSLQKELLEIIDNRTLLVFDEVHKIKSVNGKRAIAALEISKNCNYTIALSGTPIPNGYIDIYNMLNLLYPTEFNDFFGFDIKLLTNPSENEVEIINNKIYPFYCRTTKKELKIPEPEEDIIINCQMLDLEFDLFKIIYIKFHGNILELYIRLIQASTNPRLLLKPLESKFVVETLSYLDEDDLKYMKYDEKLYNIDENEDLSNSQTAIELINKIGFTSKFNSGINLIEALVSEQKQVLAWGMFVDTIHSIDRILKSKNINSLVIDGSVDISLRESLINDFKAGNYQVLISNPNTLAESISLHNNCHDAVYFEYSFNLTHMLQSRDRINRLGLKESDYTKYYYLMLSSGHFRYDSLDVKIYKRLKEKEALMLNAIEGEGLRRIDFNDIEDIKLLFKEEFGF